MCVVELRRLMALRWNMAMIGATWSIGVVAVGLRLKAGEICCADGNRPEH